MGDDDDSADSYNHIAAHSRGADTLDPWNVVSLNPCEWETIFVPLLF